MIFARAAYSLATCLLSPFALARASARQTPLREYLGFAPLSDEHQNGIWLHAVSAGEAGAAAGLLRRLAAARPDMPLVLTHTTDAGRERFSQIAAEIRRADPRARVAVCACPLDSPLAPRRFFARAKPRLGILMEVEIWPHLLAAARRRRSANGSRQRPHVAPLGARLRAGGRIVPPRFRLFRGRRGAIARG